MQHQQQLSNDDDDDDKCFGNWRERERETGWRYGDDGVDIHCRILVGRGENAE
jgi:hypothetical protein